MMATFAIRRSNRLGLVLEMRCTNGWGIASAELFRMFYTQQQGMFIAQVPYGDPRLVRRRDHVAEAWARLEAKWRMR